MERWMRVPLLERSGDRGRRVGRGGRDDAGAERDRRDGAGRRTRSSTAECTKANLSAKYKGGDAAMSHVYGRIVLRNTSEDTCYVKGYGGLSYVGKGNGTQVGAAADRTPAATPRTVLEPGDKVRSAIVETSYAPYPKKECQPTKVDGFRVYVPDETRSIFIEHKTTGCANPEIHLLEHKPYR